MLGISFDKLILLGVIAVFVIGPQRLPGYAAKLARLVRTVREMADGARERLRGEMGPEFDDIDWVKLDPRQYDPRRIMRDALRDDLSPRSDVPVRPTVRPGDRPTVGDGDREDPGSTHPE